MSEKNVAVSTTIAPLDGVDAAVLGFSNDVFSQAIYIPFTSEAEMQAVGDAIRDGFYKAARELQRRKVGLVIANEIPDGLKKRRTR